MELLIDQLSNPPTEHLIEFSKQLSNPPAEHLMELLIEQLSNPHAEPLMELLRAAVKSACRSSDGASHRAAVKST